MRWFLVDIQTTDDRVQHYHWQSVPEVSKIVLEIGDTTFGRDQILTQRSRQRHRTVC